VVSVVFYFHLIFDMALFLTLLTNSIDIVLNFYHVNVDSWITTLLTTFCLIVFSNLLTNMNTICLFSVIGTLSTILVCVMVIVSCVKEIKFSVWVLMKEYWINRNYGPNASISFPRLLSRLKLIAIQQMRCFGIYR